MPLDSDRKARALRASPFESLLSSKASLELSPRDSSEFKVGMWSKIGSRIIITLDSGITFPLTTLNTVS